MTAEVVILNKNGIALAADSAVTIGTQKVYNSANKVFALSRTQPVGVMIYGNAEFMSVPWEALIKSFRKNVLKEDTHPRLEQYAEQFLEFLRSTPLIPKETETAYVAAFVQGGVNALVKEVDNAVAQAIKASGYIDKDASDELVIETAQKWLARRKEVSAAKPGTKCKKSEAAAIRREHLAKITQQAAAQLAPLGLPEKFFADFTTFVLKELGRADSRFMQSGVVIAGYGDTEIFPSSMSYGVTGRLCGFLNATPNGKTTVSQAMHGAIVPFAQREMVDMFMSGIDPSFSDAIRDGLKKIFSSLPGRLNSSHGLNLSNEQTSAISHDFDAILQQFSEELVDKIKDQKFSRPVLAGVAALPIDELASMAESLVSLTSFKRKVTMVPESVGGPVDVAVISKGDGFIWIKRKHYFKPELNHQYFKGY